MDYIQVFSRATKIFFRSVCSILKLQSSDHVNGALACKNEFTNTYFEAQSSEGNITKSFGYVAWSLRARSSLTKNSVSFPRFSSQKRSHALRLDVTIDLWIFEEFQFNHNFVLSFQEIKSEPLEKVEDIHEDMSDSEPDVSDTCFGNQTWTWWRTSERNEKSCWTIERVAQK